MIRIVFFGITKEETPRCLERPCEIRLRRFFPGSSQEACVESARQKFSDRNRLTFTTKIRQDNCSVPGKFPNNLPARTAGRRKRVGIRDNRKLREVPFAFGQSLPDSHTLAANRQTVTRTLDIATRVNCTVLGLHRGADKEV